MNVLITVWLIAGGITAFTLLALGAFQGACDMPFYSAEVRRKNARFAFLCIVLALPSIVLWPIFAVVLGSRYMINLWHETGWGDEDA